jgi:hypothetical protein
LFIFYGEFFFSTIQNGSKFLYGGYFVKKLSIIDFSDPPWLEIPRYGCRGLLQELRQTFFSPGFDLPEISSVRFS